MNENAFSLSTHQQSDASRTCAAHTLASATRHQTTSVTRNSHASTSEYKSLRSTQLAATIRCKP